MPNVIHRSQAEKDDLKFFRRLLPMFVKRMEGHVVQQIREYQNWRSEDALLELRRRLLELTKEATLERKDGLMQAQQGEAPNRKNNPYVEIAVLAAVCYYHLDIQMQERINSLLGGD